LFFRYRNFIRKNTKEKRQKYKGKNAERLTKKEKYASLKNVRKHKSNNILGGSIMQKGTVKWFNAKKGYGFLSDAEGNEVFVHYSALQMDGFKELKDGEEVEFEVVDGTKGPQASNVVRLS
jgi:CspA family cold shock protein